MTQKAFAEVIGLSERAYRRYEQGERLPNFETLMRISVFCACTLDWLVMGDKDNRSSKTQHEKLNQIHVGLRNLLDKDDRRFGEIAKDLKKLSIQREKFKHQLGLPQGVEEYYWIEPRITEAIDMLHYIFSNASNDVKNLVMEVLDHASSLTFLGLDLKGQPLWEKTEKIEKKKPGDSHINDASKETEN